MKLIKIITLLFLAFYPFISYGLGGPDWVKIKTDTNEFIFVDLEDYDIAYTKENNTVYIGKQFPVLNSNGSGYELKLIYFKKIEFETEKQFKKWIKDVRPTKYCLTITGTDKCK